MDNYVYVPFHWLNQIIEIDEYGDVVYEKDDKGNFVLVRDDHGNLVLDPITKQPIPQPRILQQGTRQTAQRENHQEEGIAKAHERIELLINRMIRVETILEVDGRVDPDNKGTFFDNFTSPPDKLIRLLASAILIESRAAGTSVLNVDDTSGFGVGMGVTIYDATHSEDAVVTAVTASTITVTPLTKSYVKGAVIARSSTSIRNGEIVGGKWETFGISSIGVI